MFPSQLKNHRIFPSQLEKNHHSFPLQRNYATKWSILNNFQTVGLISNLLGLITYFCWLNKLLKQTITYICIICRRSYKSGFTFLLVQLGRFKMILWRNGDTILVPIEDFQCISYVLTLAFCNIAKPYLACGCFL